MKPPVAPPPGGRAFLAGALALVAVFALAGFRLRPPGPLPAEAPANRFSAVRAETFLLRLLGDGSPRPTGSPANAAAHERLLAELRGLGLEPEEQTGFSCSRSSCATVRNVLARLPGRPGVRSLLLATHYDSVGAGPGVSDDLASVAATLEIARALRAQIEADGPLPRTVVLLIDDGEEIGLLGARAFVADHPWAAEVEAVVNLEARGTSGPSFLFETSADNSWLLEGYAREAPRPATSSIFYSVYRRLPNDTDFTVFKARGWSGVNFAFIGGVPRYHTPVDDLAHLDRRSLQHQGDNALAAVRGLMAPGSGDRGGAVYFDLLNAVVVRWPVAWTLPLALTGLVLLLLTTRARSRTGRDATGLRPLSGPIELLDRMTFGSVLVGWFGALAALGAAWGAVWAALWLLRRAGAAGIAVDWPAGLRLLTALAWTLGAFAALVVGRWFGRRAGPHSAWTGWWYFFALLGIAAAWFEPSAAYVVLLPVLAAGLGGLYGVLRFGRRGVASPFAIFLPTVTAAAVIAPFAWALDAALGVPILPILGLLCGLLVLPLVPAAASIERWWRTPARWMPIVLAVAAVGLLLAALIAAPHTESSPERLSLRLHLDASAGSAHWVATPESGRLPEALARSGGFGAALEPSMPWSRAKDGYRAPAELAGAELPSPELEVLSATPSGVRLRLRSARGAPLVALVLDPPSAAAVGAARLAGHPFEPIGKRERGPDDWRWFTSWTTPPEGIELELDLAAPGVVLSGVLYDQSAGLPDSGAALLRARPATAVPSGFGDATLVSRRVTLEGTR